MNTKKHKSELFQREHFSWRLRQRDNGVYFADGRGNDPPLGRYSLETTDRKTAIRRLDVIDRDRAQQRGLIPSQRVGATAAHAPAINDGFDQHIESKSGPRVTGGITDSSKTRYRNVATDFQDYCRRNQIGTWYEVTDDVLRRYGQDMADRGRMPRTIATHLNFIKQVNKDLVDTQGLLLSSSRLQLRVRQPKERSRFCPEWIDVEIFLEQCKARPQDLWLYRAAMMLAYTGIRSGEACQLRWEDLDCKKGGAMIRIVDETMSGDRSARSTKGGRSRTIPVHSELLKVLDASPRNEDGYMLRGPTGHRLASRTLLSGVKRMAQNLAATLDRPELARLVPHSFRHGFCTHCASRGVTIFTLMQWMGHKDPETVQHYYTQHDSESFRQMERLSRQAGADDSEA